MNETSLAGSLSGDAPPLARPKKLHLGAMSQAMGDCTLGHAVDSCAITFFANLGLFRLRRTQFRAHRQATVPRPDSSQLGPSVCVSSESPPLPTNGPPAGQRYRELSSNRTDGCELSSAGGPQFTWALLGRPS